MGSPRGYLETGLDTLVDAVAVGHRADMVLLDADPRADIANTRRIRAVVADGRYPTTGRRWTLC